MNQNGTLIVIEGGDGSGKATQTKLLEDWLKSEGRSVKTLGFPNYEDNQLGSLIRECLDGKRGDFMRSDARVTSTLYAVDRFESLPVISKWLEEGKVVILDRYTSANMVHQGAKVSNPEERRELVDWIYDLEHKILQLPEPDLVLYLDVPAKIRAELVAMRGDAEDLAERNFEHQLAVDEAVNDMLAVYKTSQRIPCVQSGELDKKEVIAERIKEIARATIG